MIEQYEELKKAVLESTRKSLLETRDRVKPERLYTFALYSDDGAETIIPAANTEEGFEESLSYYRSRSSDFDADSSDMINRCR